MLGFSFQLTGDGEKTLFEAFKKRFGVFGSNSRHVHHSGASDLTKIVRKYKDQARPELKNHRRITNRSSERHVRGAAEVHRYAFQDLTMARSVTIRAAWIGVGGAVLTAIIVGLFGFCRPSSPPVGGDMVSGEKLDIDGDYVEGDKVKVEGDYIKGEKTVMNQTTQVGGDFIQIANFLDSGSTGVFVNLVPNVANFVGERKSIEESASLDDYLEWLETQGKQGLVNGHSNLLDILRREDKQGKLVRDCIETVIFSVEDKKNMLREIVEQTELLPDMNSKLDYLIDQLSKKDSQSLREGQLVPCDI